MEGAKPSAAGPREQVSRFRAVLASESPRPMVIAHRGDSSRAPENTLEAARRGFDAGADAWELDVQLTRDGVPVVIHDESLVRTTDVLRRFAGDVRERAGFLVSHFDLEEIRTLDAGSWFLDEGGAARTATAFGTKDALAPDEVVLYGSGTVRIPTLVEALTLTIERDWLANVELKSFPNTEPRLIEAVLDVIERLQAADRVLISSFDHADVARVAALRPEIATGVLAATPLHRPAEYVRNLVGADAYHPSDVVLGAGSDRYLFQPAAERLRTHDLAELRESRVPVLVYTVNDVNAGGLASHLTEAGVRGVFTDVPGPMRAFLDSR